MRRRCVCSREGVGGATCCLYLFFPPHFFSRSNWQGRSSHSTYSPTILFAGHPPPLQISSGQWKHAFQVSDHLGNTHLLQLVVELHLNITDSDGEYGAYLDAFPPSLLGRH
jgi:hypothetical protein